MARQVGGSWVFRYAAVALMLGGWMLSTKAATLPAPQAAADVPTISPSPAAPATLPVGAAASPAPRTAASGPAIAPALAAPATTTPPAGSDLGNRTAPAPAGVAGNQAPVVSPAALPVQPPALAAPKPEPITIEHPRVLDAARLADAGRPIPLFGIVAPGGAYAEGLHSFIASAGDRVTCAAQAAGEFICLLPDGTDLAMVSLANGAAQARADAPDAYREQESVAQQARRGVWQSLPAAPTELKNPRVRDTGTLIADGKTYRLDGIEGLGGKYARELHDYIAANGDTLRCQAAGQSDRYICLLADGTDIAKVALVNGAARVASDAPDPYRVQQGEALANRRGYWEHPPAGVAVAERQPVIAAPTGAVGYPVGASEGAGVAYVAGQPTAVIGGETVFLVFAAGAGWGYWDHYRHWHGAPERYAHHLDRYHPDGHGLRGYGYAPPGRRYAAPGPRESHGYGGVRPAGVQHGAGQGGFRPAMPARNFVRPAAPMARPAAAPSRAPAPRCSKPHC